MKSKIFPNGILAPDSQIWMERQESTEILELSPTWTETETWRKQTMNKKKKFRDPPGLKATQWSSMSIKRGPVPIACARTKRLSSELSEEVECNYKLNTGVSQVSGNFRQLGTRQGSWSTAFHIPSCSLHNIPRERHPWSQKPHGHKQQHKLS